MNTRKQIRLKDYDYSQNGCYFITICTADKRPTLSKIVEVPIAADTPRPKETTDFVPELSPTGKIADDAIRAIPNHYVGVFVDSYVIMPNHIHLLLRLERNDEPVAAVPEIIRQLKGYVAKRCGKAVWQKSYYEHVIRSEPEYREILQYINENPAKWCEDSLYL